MTFRFPRTRFVDTNTLKEQLDHAAGELMEAFTALEAGESDLRVAEEIVDTWHSLEGGLRIMLEKLGVNIDDVTRFVEQKNRVRGYYGE